MLILPAIDLYGGKAVRLARGDYEQMTVYSDDPAAFARGFRGAGAELAHIVDLEGARDGTTANFETVGRIITESGIDVEVGGGVRTAEVVGRYLGIGARRVILGTAAITQPGFVADMAREFGDRIAVSVDIKDGFVAIKGWTETSDKDALAFCREMADAGVQTIICTDISKDGMLSGTNMELYRELRSKLSLGLIASGGVTALEEISALAALGMDGAILGKAMYTGAIKLEDAVKAAKVG